MRHYIRHTIILTAVAAAVSCSETAPVPVVPVKEGPGRVFLEPETPGDSVLIGDRVRYGAEIYDLPAGTVIEMPVQEPLKDIRDSVLALTPWVSDTLRVNPDGTADFRETVVVTAFDKGDFLLPEIVAVLHRPDSEVADTLRLAGLTFSVKDPTLDPKVFGTEVQEGAADPNGYDIKSPIDYEYEEEKTSSSHLWRNILICIGAALALFAILWFIFPKVFRKVVAKEPELSPREEALKALETYDDRKLWAPEKQKALYSGVTDTLKRYMKRTYGFDAPEMTSDEVLSALRFKGVESSLITSLKTLFTVADFVKFAKHKAGDDENAALVPAAREFVHSTSTPPEPAEDKKEATR